MVEFALVGGFLGFGGYGVVPDEGECVVVGASFVVMEEDGFLVVWAGGEIGLFRPGFVAVVAWGRG